VKKLRGRSGYRVRIEDWRVIFEQDAEVVSILAVGPRGGIYED
jgi:mRNA interferase RelE/StbE